MAPPLASDSLPPRRIPQHPGLPLFGSFLEALRNPLGLLFDGTRNADYARYRFGPMTYILVNDPEGVQHVLVKNAANYVKSRTYDGVRHVIGAGLLTSEGETWRRNRKLVQPAFHGTRHLAFAQAFARGTDAAVDRWLGEHADGARLDAHAEMMRLTLGLVGETLFGVDLDGEAARIGHALDVTIRWAQAHIQSVVRVHPRIPTPSNVRFRRALATLDATALRIIGERRREARPPNGDGAANGSSTGAGSTAGATQRDPLGELIAAHDDAGKKLTDTELRDEVLTLVLAGHETTANNLTWTLMLLSQHPDVERRVFEEVERVVGQGPVRLSHLPALEYTERVLSESLRLLPPAWMLERDALADDVVCGWQVPRGATVAVCAYLLHRHRRYWDNPEGFDPDRWLPERSAARPRGAYLPFGDGPRVCIGKSFALIEAKVCLAAMVRRVRLELEPGARIEPEPGVTLRPRGGMPMRLWRR
ncbi:MAG: cytochrome P450 [Polyangiaceae bacterium]